MILYHGTNMTFEKILLEKCLPHKDFGRGFYLTPLHKRAKERAIDKCDKTGGGIPTILKYEFDEGNLEKLNVLKFDSTDEAWIDFILENRNRRKRISHAYDIVIGPVADDGVITSINLYEAHVIDKEILIQRLRYAKPYIQYAFCSQCSIDLLVKK